MTRTGPLWPALLTLLLFIPACGSPGSPDGQAARLVEGRQGLPTGDLPDVGGLQQLSNPMLERESSVSVFRSIGGGSSGLQRSLRTVTALTPVNRA